MIDNAKMLDLVERALDDDPFCPLCGAPTTIEDDAGRLVLVCSATLAATNIFGRLSAAVLPHERHLVIDLRESVAA